MSLVINIPCNSFWSDRPSLHISSDSQFELSFNRFSTPHLGAWDGKMFCSHDNKNWTQINSNRTIMSNEDGNLYLCGKGNSYLCWGDYNLGHKGWAFSRDVECHGDIDVLIDFQKYADGTLDELPNYALRGMFYGLNYNNVDCDHLILPPTIKFNKLGNQACTYMFNLCKRLSAVPRIRATTLGDYCCASMYFNCGIRLYSTQSETRPYLFRVPYSGSVVQAGESPCNGMFDFTSVTLERDYYIDRPTI